MFSSQFTHSLDSKGRLPLPPRWRKKLGSAVIVTRGFDACLFVFPAKRFSTLALELGSLGLARADSRALSRHLFAEAIDDALDGKGRLALTPTLLRFAGIDDEVVVIGANDRLEIWSPTRYAEQDARVESEVAAVAERVAVDLQRAREPEVKEE